MPGLETAHRVKLVIVGDANVGKTCATQYFCRGISCDRAEKKVTLGVDFLIADRNIEGNLLRLNVWDTAGMEKNNNVLQPCFYRDAAIVMIMFSIDNRKSFESCSQWIDKAKMHCNNPEVLMQLVGNKADMSGSRAVREQEARDFATGKFMGYCETSAKTGMNIEEAFVSLL